MPATRPSTPTLLECLEVVTSHTGLNAADQSYDITRLCPALERVRKFFGCDEKQATILSIIIMEGYEGNAVSARVLLTRLAIPMSQLADIELFLRNLRRIGWTESRDRYKNSMVRSYQATHRLLEAAFHERRSILKSRRIEQAGDLIHKMNQLIEQYASVSWQQGELYQEMKKIHRHYGEMPLVAWLTGLRLPQDEMACLYLLIYKRLNGEVDVDIDDMAKSLLPHASDRFRFKKDIVGGQARIVSEGLVRLEKCMAGRMVELNLGHTLESKLAEFDLAIQPEHQESKTLEMINHGNIFRKKLMFEAELSGQVESLRRLLDPERFIQVQERLQAQGMSTGILALLHGIPGSGKTESVLQLGAETGRDIFRVDISHIRSKWVGDSEKNIRSIFEAYRKILFTAEKTPILLFNEADSVLSKRLALGNAVDQMHNTMQNILLEEMEQFSGILFATTNLVTNLDDAFERRFTYKLRFNKTGIDVRLNIWRNHFPELTDDIIIPWAEDLDLSPAQIENLRKRYEIHRILYDDPSIDDDFIRTLARQEHMVEKQEKNSIGFRAR